MILSILHWCRGKARVPRERRADVIWQHRADQSASDVYDAGYRTGYRDCAEFIADWIEESGEEFD